MYTYSYLFQVSSKAFSPVHTHWYIHLSFPPHPPPSTLLSEWPARALWSAHCSHWKAGATCCHPPAAPSPCLCLRVVSESGRSPRIVAGHPCILRRTNRAEGPWAERRRGYSAMAPPKVPCEMELKHTCIQIGRVGGGQRFVNTCSKTPIQ